MTEKNDRIRMSWEKKVSMSEIAQFYEDKLRELDAKNTVLEERQKSMETRMDELGVKLETTFHAYFTSRKGVSQLVDEAILGTVDPLIKATRDAVNFMQEDLKAVISVQWNLTLTLFSILFQANEELRKEALTWLDVMEKKGLTKLTQSARFHELHENIHRQTFVKTSKIAIDGIRQYLRTGERTEMEMENILMAEMNKLLKNSDRGR